MTGPWLILAGTFVLAFALTLIIILIAEFCDE